MFEDELFATLQKAWQTTTRQANQPGIEQRLQSAAGLALTRPARIALTLLSDSGPLHVSELAAVSGVDVSTMSRTLRHLVDSGFIAREPGEDLRAVRISLTSAGEEAVDVGAQVGGDLEQEGQILVGEGGGGMPAVVGLELCGG